LHCCYCCSDADAATALLEGAFGLRVGMRPSGGRSDGAILGLDREIEARVAFVFDARGPRTSPAIEVSGWVDPPVTGEPYGAPNQVGIQAVGISVRDLDVALANAARHGAVASGETASGPWFGARAAALRDPTGVRFDLVESKTLEGEDTRLRHLRITCRDLERSAAWYRRIGFSGEAPQEIEIPGGALGQRRSAVIRAVRLSLPDEPTALLLHEWIEPASTGVPYALPYHRGFYRAALAVDDARSSVRALEAAAIPIERPPRRIELAGTRVPDMWIAFLHDPDGVPIELVERPRSAFR
jgi:catechol 2,3-dioxygenase-like lactoylglutathione lyase family enzyme